MRATVPAGGSHNFVLKSGLLFPGAIFGASGSGYEIGTFIKDFKAGLPGDTTPNEGWARFQERVGTYDFSRDRTFELILSSRHLGKPTLYRMRSVDRSILPIGNFGSTGSGGELLDARLRKLHEERPALRQLMPDARFKELILPHMYCHWLTENSLGLERTEMETRYHVGGLFHFSLQTANEESRQDPALFVVCSMSEPNGVICAIHRLYFVGGSLVHEHDGVNIVSSIAETPAVTQMDKSETTQWLNAIRQQGTLIPPYFYCGFLFSDPAYRNHLMYAISYNGKYLWHPRAGLSAACAENLKKIFSGEYVPSFSVGDDDENEFVPVSIDEGMSGFEIQSMLAIPAKPCSGDRDIYERIDDNTDAALRLTLHADNTIEFVVRDSAGDSLSVKADERCPEGPFCLGASLILLDQGTILTVYIDGRVVGQVWRGPRLCFACRHEQMSVWLNRSSTNQATGELITLETIEFSQALMPYDRGRLVERLDGKSRTAEDRMAIWLCAGSYGFTSPGSKTMQFTDGVFPLPYNAATRSRLVNPINTTQGS